MELLIEDIINYFEEARKRNYSEYIVKTDVNKILTTYISKIRYNLEDYYEVDEDSIREDIHDDAYDEGYEDGKDSMNENLMHCLCEHVNNLKSDIKEGNISSLDEVNARLTELVLAVDEVSCC